jgi:hypothetical protein
VFNLSPAETIARYEHELDSVAGSSNPSRS